MTAPLDQHQREIQRNLAAWENKPLLRKIYNSFYDRILALVDQTLAGRVVEIGSGAGNLRSRLPDAICTDLFSNPWLTLVCDGYELPFRSGSLSHLILFDVFHHLETPTAFLNKARRVLIPEGRLILFEPFISLASHPAYGLFHHEPVAMKGRLDLSESPSARRNYYAAQGNATRLFFRREVPGWPAGWKVVHAETFSCFAYLLSGGYSKPALYPTGCLPVWQRIDRTLSRWPALAAGRCLIALQPQPTNR